MKLPAQVELLRSRLPPEYAPPAPIYDTSMNTEHSLEVVVATLLALTDGKLAEMQNAADTDILLSLHLKGCPQAGDVRFLEVLHAN